MSLQPQSAASSFQYTSYQVNVYARKTERRGDIGRAWEKLWTDITVLHCHVYGFARDINHNVVVISLYVSQGTCDPITCANAFSITALLCHVHSELREKRAQLSKAVAVVNRAQLQGEKKIFSGHD